MDVTSGAPESSVGAASADVQVAKPAPRELKVEDALLYLDQVKMEFSDKPHIYNEFLEIMKNFKSHQINTPGVIERVKNLFRGYNKLILGFNTFLPEGGGYKIELTPEEEAGAYSNQEGETFGNTASSAQVGGEGAPAAASRPPQQMQQQQHAISYVTTIRNRFASEPDTYRAFLKILHTYQKEQKGIKDVLEQVSLLFADHPDLLMEFTHFLPDAVQDQAKERLNRAARESEMRRRFAQAQQQTQHQQLLGKRGAGGSRKNASYQHQQYMQQQHAMQQAQLAQQRRQQKGFQHQMRRYDEMSRGRESSHVSVTTERRFFDTVKDLLTSTTREGWPEFVKHLDLFVNDAITKRDLLHFAQDIFGPAGQDLYAELKRIMAARADYDGHGADMYYAIPTSEIDFTQCRKCTPSYRSLPKDYPKPLCSERSEMEESVLNDEWITFPFGHEDNYTFRHMQKNVYEEELFKCEEDRFEIDMIIDSNYCTIRILEPIAEEIANMRSMEDNQDGNSGPRFQLQLEKRNLSCIHLNSISRLYGEHGAEILELLHKNPAGTIPIVLKRLKQKDIEWRKARQDLNVKWKETVERNYERSFDHRSFYFKKQDKRFLDMKQLCSDIRDYIPAGEPGTALVEGENIPTAAADTQTTGGAATHASSTSVDVAELELSQTTRSLSSPGKGFVDILGRSNAAPVKHIPLLKGIKPQLSLRFDNKHHGVHKDIHSMFCHVAETATLPASDKERVSFIWRDLLRVFFNLPVHYLYSDMSANAATVLADASSKVKPESRSHSAMDVEGGGPEGSTPVEGTATATAVAAGLSAAALDAVPVDSSEAWAPGVRVLTAYGSGVVTAYRVKDSMYVVGLCFGTAFVKPSSIIGAEELSAAALQALGVVPGATPSDEATVMGAALPNVNTYSGDPFGVAPAAAAAPAPPVPARGSRKEKSGAAPSAKNAAGQFTFNESIPEPCRLLLSSAVGYSFIRMYHCIYTRLSYARELAEAINDKRIGQVNTGIGSGTGMTRGEGRLHPLAHMDASDYEARLVAGNPQPKSAYSMWFGQLLGLLDTTLDSARYEDSCRQLLGNRSYALFTLDKLVAQCFKTLQQMANEELFNKLVGAFVYNRSQSSSFTTISKLAGSGANYAVAAGNSVNAAAVKPPSGGRGRGAAAAAAAAVESAHPTAIKNIEAVHAAIAEGGVDPISYCVHVAKILGQSGVGEDLYRIQNITNPESGSYQEGDSVVVCQLLGSIGGAHGNQEEICKGNLVAACKGSA